MYLAFAPYGESLVVTGVRADGNLKRHLESLGILPGCVMTSLYDNGGDVVVKIGDGKLGDCKIKRRLFDMGLTPGAEVVLRKVAPLGDPVEVTLRGYELSLRKAEAHAVLTEV